MGSTSPPSLLIGADWTRKYGDMTHAEQYSTSEPCCPRPRRKEKSQARRLRRLAGRHSGHHRHHPLLVASGLGRHDRRRQGQGRQHRQADPGEPGPDPDPDEPGPGGRLPAEPTGGQIAANQAEVTKDQAEVTKDQNQLRTQAIADYTSSWHQQPDHQMFSGNPNTSVVPVRVRLDRHPATSPPPSTTSTPRSPSCRPPRARSRRSRASR